MVEGNIVDVRSRRIFRGTVSVADGKISEIRELGPEKKGLPYILPGFIDSHVHIESSMMLPDAFAACAAEGGVVGSVSDPHEIANVLGVEGVRFMTGNAAATPFHIVFGAPSCVPSTSFETAGASLGAAEVASLLDLPGVGYLSEVMNVPGVIFDDPEMDAKLAAARDRGLPIDGHAPSLSGDGLAKYVAKGISTDHECTSLAEAREKIAAGMVVLIREGSAAKSFEELWPLIDEAPGKVMFCTDDSHPDYLAGGPIRSMVRRAVGKGCCLWNVLEAACVAPVRHYRMDVGLMREGESADFVVVSDLRDFDVVATGIRGTLYGPSNPLPVLPRCGIAAPNKFVEGLRVAASDFVAKPSDPSLMDVIKVFDGSLVTGKQRVEYLKGEGGCAISDPSRDILKIVVLNRYERGAAPAVGFISGYGIRGGAIAATVAHDSHNIVAVGADDESLACAINAVAASKGGYAVVSGSETAVLELPVAGLMSLGGASEIMEKYVELKTLARESLGCAFADPFMSLSFMALPVIPELKMTDKGLFDYAAFSHVKL